MAMIVEIRQAPITDEVEIFIGARKGNKIEVWKPVELTCELQDEGVSIEPTFKIPGLAAKEFLPALTDALARIGIKPESNYKIEGLLEATKDHLQDMRKLVFKGEQNAGSKI